jgi:hypothetical protein
VLWREIFFRPQTAVIRAFFATLMSSVWSLIANSSSGESLEAVASGCVLRAGKPCSPGQISSSARDRRSTQNGNGRLQRRPFHLNLSSLLVDQLRSLAGLVLLLLCFSL